MFIFILFRLVARKDNLSQIDEITNSILMYPYCFICLSIISQFWWSGCTKWQTNTYSIAFSCRYAKLGQAKLC